jgi:drug/metabolite transporter (DMT)-like permease
MKPVATIPLFSMVLGRLMGIERLTTQSMVGLLLGFGGIVMLVGFPSVPVTASFVLGCAASILGSLSAAIGSLYASRRLAAAGPWEITTGAFLIGGLMTLPLLLLVPIPVPPAPVDYLYLLVLGGVMSAATYVVYFRLVASIGTTRAISVEFAVTVVAVLVGAFLLDERLSEVQVAGAAVIVAGCALVLGLVPGLEGR